MKFVMSNQILISTEPYILKAQQDPNLKFDAHCRERFSKWRIMSVYSLYTWCP